jgi:hypothetical protein
LNSVLNSGFKIELSEDLASSNNSSCLPTIIVVEYLLANYFMEF